MRALWMVAVAAVAAGGGFAAGRFTADPEVDRSADLAFAKLLDQSDTAVEPAVSRPVDPAVRAYAARLMNLADSSGADPRTLRLVRQAAVGQAVADLGDADGDGLDDDGKVQFGPACVLLPISASYEVKVQAGSCSGAVAQPLDGDIAYGPKRFPESYLRTL